MFKFEVKNPEDFISSRDYLNDLIITNTGDTRSIRWFSHSLEWSPSLIHDILAKRKKLSLKRGLELSQFFQLGEVLTEKLVYLILSESKEIVISNYYREKRERSLNIIIT
jgi:hypothetical protein